MDNICKFEIELKNDQKLDISKILVPDVHGIYSRNLIFRKLDLTRICVLEGRGIFRRNKNSR